MSRVALVFMPFGSLLQPSLALGQIQGQLVEAGMDARSHYLNFDFACRFDVTIYEQIAKIRGVDTQTGEWLFAGEAWDQPTALTPEAFMEASRNELASVTPHVDLFIEKLLDFRKTAVPAYLDDMVDRLLADPDLKVVGFSCMFFQTVPAVALAKRLKARRPDLKMVFGGPCFHGEMGIELMAKIPWIDVVCTGEADTVIVDLFETILRGDKPSGIAGVRWRADDGAVIEGPPFELATPETLEALPHPIYDDYFTKLATFGLDRDPSLYDRIFIPYESSRGCWWGQKQHCTFCGLNAQGMNYRNKSAERAHEQIVYLRETYGINKLFAVDNILPHKFYKSFLPMMRADDRSRDVEVFYEIKTNLSRGHVQALAEGGIKWVVPGIESLSSNILKCLSKGVSALQNIYALKLFAEYGIFPGWNLLIRIPGEAASDYDDMTAVIPQLTHLHPPFGGPRKVEMHRFSPYFFNAEHFVSEFHPQSWYRGIFPEQQFDIEKLAYYFDAEWQNVQNDDVYEACTKATWAWVDRWRNQTSVPRLAMQARMDGTLEIEDTRGETPRLWRLDALEAKLYLGMEDPATLNRLVKIGDGLASEGEVAAKSEEFVRHGLAINEAGQYLGLATRPGTVVPDAAYRRAVLQRVGQDAERHVG